jgi:hypothetical protein
LPAAGRAASNLQSGHTHLKDNAERLAERVAIRSLLTFGWGKMHADKTNARRAIWQAKRMPYLFVVRWPPTHHTVHTFGGRGSPSPLN